MNTDKELDELTAEDITRAIRDHAIAHLFGPRDLHGLPLAMVNGTTYAVAEDEDALRDAIIDRLRNHHEDIEEEQLDLVEDTTGIPAAVLHLLACTPRTQYGVDLFREAIETTSSAREIADDLIDSESAPDFFGYLFQYRTQENIILLERQED